MDKDVEQAKRDVEGWYLGKTSARYESGGRGPGVISTGVGDHGGVSYGAYQLSSKQGTLREYLGQSRYGPEFKGLQPATPAFDAKWRELAKTDPGFAQDQHDFIGKTHYEQQVSRLEAIGVDLSGRGRAVQDLVWSTSVQFRNLTPGIFQKGLMEKFGPDYELSRLSDRDIVEAVQGFKINHNNTLFKSSPTWHSGLLRRAHAEKSSLLGLIEQESLLAAHGVAMERSQAPSKSTPQDEEYLAIERAFSPILKYGSRGEDVRMLQQRLHELGYSGLGGKPLAADGDFADNTRHAVRSFQQVHGLSVDGVVGSDTKRALANAEKRPLLSERPHEDSFLFHQVKSSMRLLSEGEFSSDVELDRAAGSLVSTAKLQGLSHIDHVTLNTRGDRLIGIQGNLQDPDRHVVSIDKAQAISQSLQHSTAQLAEQRVVRDEAERMRVQMEQMEHRNGLVMGVRP